MLANWAQRAVGRCGLSMTVWNRREHAVIAPIVSYPHETIGLSNAHPILVWSRQMGITNPAAADAFWLDKGAHPGGAAQAGGDRSVGRAHRDRVQPRWAAGRG